MANCTYDFNKATDQEIVAIWKAMGHNSYTSQEKCNGVTYSEWMELVYSEMNCRGFTHSRI